MIFDIHMQVSERIYKFPTSFPNNPHIRGSRPMSFDYESFLTPMDSINFNFATPAGANKFSVLERSLSH